VELLQEAQQDEKLASVAVAKRNQVLHLFQRIGGKFVSG
jgi:hypothetical protein